VLGVDRIADLYFCEGAFYQVQYCTHGTTRRDLRFKELVGTLLADHPQHLDPPSLANFMHVGCVFSFFVNDYLYSPFIQIFSETEKLDYAGEQDDNQMFSFTCFNPEGMLLRSSHPSPSSELPTCE
jgi:hypothetical protein